MNSDNVIAAYPLAGMVQRVQNLKFVTEHTPDNRYFMSIATVEGTFRFFEFDTLQSATNMTANFIGFTSGLFATIITNFQVKIGSILSA